MWATHIYHGLHGMKTESVANITFQIMTNFVKAYLQFPMLANL